MRRGRLTGRAWPPWWKWELELSFHILKRMVDREFTEVDLLPRKLKAGACSVGHEGHGERLEVDETPRHAAALTFAAEPARMGWAVRPSQRSAFLNLGDSAWPHRLVPLAETF